MWFIYAKISGKWYASHFVPIYKNLTEHASTTVNRIVVTALLLTFSLNCC